MATPFQFKEQDLRIREQLQDLITRDHLPDNFVIFDYDSFSEEVSEVDSFFACKFLSENFHVIIVTKCGTLENVNFKSLDSKSYTVISAVPLRMLKNIVQPAEHVATVVMAYLTEFTKSNDRKAFYCLSADKNFPSNTEMIGLIGDEFVYCCVMKCIRDFLNLEKHFQKYPDDPVSMRLYRLLKNGVPRDDSDPKNCGKIMFFCYGDEYTRKFGAQPYAFTKVKVQTLWQELKQFADNYHPHPLHVSVTTAFPSKRKDCTVIEKYPELTKPKFYRFLIYLPDASEYEVLSILESLRVQHPKFRSTVWSQKFDKDTKEKKFGSLGDTNIPKGRVYKLGDRHVLQKDTSFGEHTNFQTRYFKDLYLDDDHIKQLLLEAKQQGATMKVRHAKVLFCGASGAGKTSFCRLLKNIPLDEKWNSTGLGDSQQIMILEKATIKSNKWTELNPAEEINQLKLHLKYGKLTEAKTVDTQADTDTTSTDTNEANIVTASQLQYNVGSQQVQAAKTTYCNKKIPEVEKCLTSNYYNAEKQDSNSAELPEIWDILTLLDTGGQPQFINMLPAVNSSATITFVVLNMTGKGNILEERIRVHHFKNGIRSYEPYPLNYTNEDLIKCLVALLKDSIVKDVPLPVEIISKKATDHKPGLCFVGTHLDEVEQETVDIISKKLDKIVDHLEPNDNICIFNLNGILLFPVNNTIAGKDSSQDSIANKIRLKVQKMVEEKAVYEVPITWILLELEIRRVCSKQKRHYLPFSEVLALYNNIISEASEHCGIANTELEAKAALQFHHMFGVLLYFHDVPGMNDYVISNPQWLFANLTNLVCCSFDSTIVDHRDIRKFKSKGILGEGLIKKINTDSLGGIDIKHFFTLLQHLKILTPFPNPESPDYLMLCILDSFKGNTSSVLDLLPPLLSVGLLIQFKSRTLPRGIFCCLVVQLIQSNSANWALQPTFDDQRCIYENLVVFCIQHSGHYLVLLDKVTHLEIQIRPINKESDNAKQIHYDIQQCVTEALVNICLCKCDDFNYGFYCNNKNCLKPILSLSSEDINSPESFPQYLTCEDHGLVDIKSNIVWFKPTNNKGTTDKPTIKWLNNHVRGKVAGKWYDLGVQLLSDEKRHKLDIIRCNHPQDVETCCMEMFKYWLNVDSEANRNQLIKALEAIDENTLAKEIS